MDVRKDHKRLLNNLIILQKLYTTKALAAVIGIERSTWSKRMKEPWRTFSYDDFRSIAKYCKVDFTKLMEGEINV
jgi:hypothetical protein